MGLGGPFVEELGYRGLAVGLRIRLCGWLGNLPRLLVVLAIGATLRMAALPVAARPREEPERSA